MKSLNRSNWLTGLGLLLAFPTAWFIFMNAMNEIGIHGLYNFSEPLFEKMGSKQSLGLNINLLILFGPVAACFLTVFQVLKIEQQSTERHFHFHIAIRKKWFPILVAAFSLSLLAILSFYLFGENYNQ